MKKITWFDIFLILIGRRIKYRVQGNSMLPTMKEGDIVLIKRCRDFAAGDIVLANHPYKLNTRILKRISSISRDHKFTLEGDNTAESTDSRIFGDLAGSEIIGKVIAITNRRD